MPTAAVLLRTGPDYRREAFAEGLRAAGFKVIFQQDPEPQKDDVLLIWNRYGVNHSIANRYERCGATVLVTENGWIGRDEKGQKVYALCHRHHNGAGWWRIGKPGRFAQFGAKIDPWRQTGKTVLVLPQRGIGPPGVAMPGGWTSEIQKRLREVTDRPIVVRPHPGNGPKEPIDFSGIYAAVTWASGAGIKAIAAGIPVFYEMPNWIGGRAAVHGISNIEEPFLGDRMPMFEDLAWAQFTLAEITEGVPFKCLA